MSLLGRDWKPFLGTLITAAKRQQIVEETTTTQEKLNQTMVKESLHKKKTRRSKTLQRSIQSKRGKVKQQRRINKSKMTRFGSWCYRSTFDPALDVETRETGSQLTRAQKREQARDMWGRPNWKKMQKRHLSSNSPQPH